MHLVNAAIGPESGEMTFNIGSDEQSNSLSAVQGDQQGIRVRVVSIADYRRDQKIDRIDIMKMDIEGYELHALRHRPDAPRSSRVGLLHCEVRFEPSLPNARTSPNWRCSCASRGYRVYGLYDAIYTPNLRFDWGDAIFVSDQLLKTMR